MMSFVIAGLIVAQGSAQTAAQTAATSTMPVVQNGIFVDQNGMTLYTFSKDTAGMSNCAGACAALWPPLLVPGDAKTSGKFSIITRADGTKQWAYNNQPLYLFSKDTAPGQKNGDGFKGLWSVVKP
jgi:predicted lipoprotein with Yx(FWY)xxD motif